MSKKRDNRIQNLVLFLLGIFSILIVSYAVTTRPHKTSTRATEVQQKTRYIDPLYPEYEIHPNISYSNKGGRDYSLDLYEPKGDVQNTRPAIVWIHGGGFVSGSKEIMAPYAEYFVKRGYVTVTINYRLGTIQPVLTRNSDMSQVINNPLIRNAETDAQTAVRWLRTNAQTYRIDADKIFVGGSSAGGVTALLVGYDYEFTQSGEFPGIPQTVSAVVSIAGTTDPKTLSPNDSPLIMFHGEKDNVVPFELAKKVKDVADANAIQNEFWSYPDETHGLKEHADEIKGKIALFLVKYVGTNQGDLPPVTPRPTAIPDGTTENKDVPADTNRLISFMKKHSQRICALDKKRVVFVLHFFQMSQADIESAYDDVCAPKGN